MKAYQIIRAWATVLMLGYSLTIMFAVGAFLAWQVNGRFTPFAVWSLWLVGYILSCYAAAKTRPNHKKGGKQ